MLQLTQPRSTCDSNHATGQHVAFCARPTGAPTYVQHDPRASCSSAATTSGRGFQLECTEVLQDPLDMHHGGQSCSIVCIPVAAHGSSISYQQHLTPPHMGGCRMTSAQQGAEISWEYSDCFKQLCNNLAGAATESAVVDSKQHGQQLQGGAAAAVAAGSSSVHRRLIITDLSVYPESSCSSWAALAQANKIMASVALPGGLQIYDQFSDDLLVSKVSACFSAAAAHYQQVMSKLQ